MAGVTFDHVQKQFGPTTIVADFHLEIPEGKFTVLVGGSGCGKSTTLRMLAGLESVSAGTIRIQGRDVTHAAPGARDVAMVFQDYALYPHLTARGNIELGLRLRKIPPAEIKRRVDWAAEILGLNQLLDRKPAAMSGGQRQRVAMGRAIVREPKVFLFDEPLSNLDAKLRGQMRVEIGRLQRKLGTTTLYVTHDQIEAMTLAQLLVVLDGGKIQQVGTPMEIYRSPVNRFVAGFIGTPPMNFIDGELSDGAFATKAVTVPLPPTRRPRQTDGKATIGLRPDELRLAVNGEPSTIRGKVIVAERLGGQTHLHVESHGETIVAVVPTDRELAPDEPVGLVVDPERVHLFGGDGVTLLS